MGKAPDEDYRNKPMTPPERQLLLEEINKLPPEIRGSDPESLVEFIDDAVTQPLSDEEEFFHRHGGSEYDLYRTTLQKIGQLSADLVKAANGLRKFIAPEADDPRRHEYEQRYPWFDSVDDFESMVARRFAGHELSDWGSGRHVAAVIQRAVQELGPVKIPPLKRGTRENFDFSDLIVRAVCFYRATQDLPPVLSWGEVEHPGDREKGRWREKPLPQTDVARLIVAVAIGTNHTASNSHLRGCLNKYRDLLKNKKRGPALWDSC